MTLPGNGNSESYDEGSPRHVGDYLEEAAEHLIKETLYGRLVLMLMSGNSTFEDFRVSVSNDFCAEENDTDVDMSVEELIWRQVDKLEKRTSLVETHSPNKFAHTHEVGPIEDSLFSIITDDEIFDIAKDEEGLAVYRLGDRNDELAFFEKEPIKERPFYKWVMVQAVSEHLELIYTISPEQSDKLDSLVIYMDIDENEAPTLVCEEA